MPGRSYESEGYRYGFNGKEKDDDGEWGNTTAHDYGARIYDPAIARFLSTDPLQSGIPSWSPYVYSIDNPIAFVDEAGEWPGVTYMYFEMDIGAGIGWGLNYVEQSGIAYDEVGRTHFTMVSALYIANQNLEDGSPNPEMITGASVSLSAGVTQDWSHETFIGDISGYNGELGGIEVYEGAGAEIGFGEKRFTANLGIGVGLKLSVLNTRVKQSISLTDAQADIVNDATDVTLGSWIINNRQYNSGTDSWTGTVSTKNKKGELVDTGIQISSNNVVDDNGTNKPTGVWSSQLYRTEAARAEKE